MRLVRGVDADVFARLADLVTLRPDARVNLNTASEPVLGALPGLSANAAKQIMVARRTGTVFETLESVVAILDSTSRAVLEAEFASLRRRTTFVSNAYRIEAVGMPPGNGHPVVLDALVAVNGSRLSVVTLSERRWP